MRNYPVYWMMECTGVITILLHLCILSDINVIHLPMYVFKKYKHNRDIGCNYCNGQWAHRRLRRTRDNSLCGDSQKRPFNFTFTKLGFKKPGSLLSSFCCNLCCSLLPPSTCTPSPLGHSPTRGRKPDSAFTWITSDSPLKGVYPKDSGSPPSPSPIHLDLHQYLDKSRIAF